VRGLALLVLLGFAALLSAADKPIWANGAIPLRGNLQRIVSPDGKVTLEVRRGAGTEGDSTLLVRILKPVGAATTESLDRGAEELLWSPDSSAFLVNGSTSSYAGFFTTIYRISTTGLQKLGVTQAAQSDMVSSFPPCRATKRDEQLCRSTIRNPNFNISGVAWLGTAQVVVAAEVPCSSSYGGIMCQVQGYVISVPEGSLVERLSAKELKGRWQSKMAWQMRIPDPPVYDDDKPVQAPRPSR
jgi:hypothetical protein